MDAAEWLAWVRATRSFRGGWPGAVRRCPASRRRLVTDSLSRDHSPMLVPVSDRNLGNQHLGLGAK